MNGAIWQALYTLAQGSPEWTKTCRRLYRGLPDQNQKTGRHVIWYDNFGGENADAFGSDVGNMIAQFTMVSASKTDRRIDDMIRATRTLFHNAKLRTAEMLVGHLVLRHTARVTILDGSWDAQLDAEVIFQGATQVPAFPGRG